MSNKIKYEIIKCLIDSKKPYLTAQQIAQILKVSRRTIFNNMDSVRKLCTDSGADLISVKSKGYTINNPLKLKPLLADKDDYIIRDREEYKLYIIYLLISDDEPIRISELEKIMYLSRPTIYKILDEISIWFNSQMIELVLSRNGIYIKTGEKRLRSAIKTWIKETKKYLDTKKANDYDHFKLHKSLEEFLVIDISILFGILTTICENNNIYLSVYELKDLSILLDVMIYRINNGYTVNIRDMVTKVIRNVYGDRNVDNIYHYLKNNVCNKIDTDETIYILTNILVKADIEDISTLDNIFKDSRLNSAMIKECEEYIRNHLNLSDDIFTELLTSIKYIIKKELIFQISKDTNVSKKYYNLALKDYHATVEMAKDLYLIITKYYCIKCYEKVLYKLVFILLYATARSKSNLRVVLYHDCDFVEFKYILLCLQNLPMISLVYITDIEPKLNYYLNKECPDLIISTIPYNNETYPVLNISKYFGSKELIENIKEINKLYQIKSFKKLLKNIDVDY